MFKFFSYLLASKGRGAKMKLTITILSILVAINAKSIEDDGNKANKTACAGIMINGVYHEKEILKAELDRPYLLAIDHTSGNLYFSYNLNDEEFQCARLNIHTKDFEKINGVKDGFAHAVDQKSQDVYIGGRNGIYKYDHINKIAELYSEEGKDIWTLFFKDVLYFSEFPSQFLYTVSNGESVRFKDLEDTKVDLFLIDEQDNMFYTNATGLYSQKKGTKNSILIKQSEGLSIRGITTDVNDNVYVCVSDGIYLVKKVESGLEKVVNIEDAFGLAFDSRNNIIYADGTQLVILKPNKHKSC